jgi:hypothetical protein
MFSVANLSGDRRPEGGLAAGDDRTIGDGPGLDEGRAQSAICA